MEKMVKSNFDHKEYMRVAMLKHEETFREQVYELHRLYRVQKMLMENTGLSQQQQKQKQERFLVGNKKAFTIDYNQQHEAQRSMLADGTSKSNVTLLERPNEQVLCETISRLQNSQDNIVKSNNNNMMLDESELELTLSLGPTTTHNPRRRKTGSGHESLSSSSTGSSQTRTSPKNNTSSLSMRDQFTWAGTNFSQGAEIEPGFSNGQPNNHPWLFQALSLKLS